MDGFLILWLVFGVIIFMFAGIGFLINLDDRDEELAAICASVAVLGLFWPVTLPLAILAGLVLMVTFVLVKFGWMKEPGWWPW